LANVPKLQVLQNKTLLGDKQIVKNNIKKIAKFCLNKGYIEQKYIPVIASLLVRRKSDLPEILKIKIDFGADGNNCFYYIDKDGKCKHYSYKRLYYQMISFMLTM
jgi:hypothetical protein